MILVLKWVAIVFGAIVAIIIGYLLSSLISLIRSLKKLESSNPPPEGTMPLLAFGNILAGFNPVKTFKIQEEKEETIQDLKDYWRIFNRKTAIETLAWLLNEGHRTRYEAYFAPVLSEDRKALEQVIASRWNNDEDEWDDEINTTLAQFKLYKRKLRWMGYSKKRIVACKSMNAWDYDRTAAVARFCLHTGYIDEQECLGYLKKVAELAKREFTSWREYVLSFLVGRAICYNASSVNLLCFSIMRRFMMRKSLWNLYPLQKIEWDGINGNIPVMEESSDTHERFPQIELLYNQAEKLAEAYHETGNDVLMLQVLECYLRIVALAQQEELYEEYNLALARYMDQAEKLGLHYIESLQFDEAAGLFRRMKAVASTVVSDTQRHTYLDTAIGGINHVGTAFGESGYQEESLELFLEAIDDYWQLSDAMPECLIHVAMLQSNIGYLYILNSDYDKARDILHKALGTYKYIREKNSDKLTPDMEGDVYTNLGLLSLHLEENKQAVQAFGQACRRYRKALKMVAPESIDVVRAGYATVLSNLGSAYRDLNRRFPAMLALRKSLKIRRRLADQYPDENEYRSDLSDCYINIGNLCATFLMLGRAVKNYEKAIRLREPLAEADPDRYLQSLADAYNNWIIMSEARPIYSVRTSNQLIILNYCEKRLITFAKLKENGQDVDTHEIAETNALAGKLCVETEQYAQAQNYLMDALLLYHEIENDLDFDQWFNMMESMSRIIVLFADIRKDKKNAIVMLNNLSKRYHQAPEAFRLKADKIRESIKRLTDILMESGVNEGDQSS